MSREVLIINEIIIKYSYLYTNVVFLARELFFRVSFRRSDIIFRNIRVVYATPRLMSNCILFYRADILMRDIYTRRESRAGGTVPGVVL